MEIILVKLNNCFFLSKPKYNFLEALSPIYIRAPNPTIILRSDLHRLRAQLTTRPPGNITSKQIFQIIEKTFF